MSMSLRLRAVCRRPATSSPQRLVDQPLDVEEQVLVGAVVEHLADAGRARCRRAPSRSARASSARDDALLGQHHQVRVVDRHQRRQQQLLGVLEVLVEDVGDVFGGELHLLAVYCAGSASLGGRAGSRRVRMRRCGDSSCCVVVALRASRPSSHTARRRRRRDTLADGRADAAGRDHPRPLGHQPHLRAERSRPVLRAGLRGREGPAVPVRDLAAAGHRHGGRDPRPARADARSSARGCTSSAATWTPS